MVSWSPVSHTRPKHTCAASLTGISSSRHVTQVTLHTFSINKSAGFGNLTLPVVPPQYQTRVSASAAWSPCASSSSLSSVVWPIAVIVLAPMLRLAKPNLVLVAAAVVGLALCDAGETMISVDEQAPPPRAPSPLAFAVSLYSVHTKLQLQRSSGHDEGDADSAALLFVGCLYYHWSPMGNGAQCAVVEPLV